MFAAWYEITSGTDQRGSLVQIHQSTLSTYKLSLKSSIPTLHQQLFSYLIDNFDGKPPSLTSFCHTSMRFHTQLSPQIPIATYWKDHHPATNSEWTSFFKWLGSKRSVFPHFTEWYYHLQICALN
ncbi:hypothetical protein CANARDRAFT_26308 [[Candida] arabinofermentans NRRL YB-2248]|uniref:Uncharacterized protein n=1 Tax=[Candida] arabinofermentans NRRL YB-2248 TaxID=983967 RepID=A0A1E4T8T1_9ASCO|nr:hypothetical protein CANARDRAFT_26308 [[Candida] arabinofermentans NRRL YB-2248]